MSIVFVNRYFFPDHSATSQILSDLAFELAEGGENVHIVTSRLSYDDPSALHPANERVRGVAVHRVWTSRFGRRRLAGRLVDYLTFYPSAFLLLLRLIRAGDIVIAKTDPPLLSVPVSLAARLRGATLVNWLQDLFPEAAAALGVKGAQGLMGRVLRRLRDQTLRAAAMNVVLGKRMAAAILQRGIVASRIMAIPNWADGDLIRPGVAEKNPLRTEWGLADKLVVGYSGNLGRAHEFRTILAAAELLRNDPKFVFLFVGEGYWASWVREEAARIGLKNVILKGYQPRELLSVSLAVPDVHVISLLPEVEGYIVPSKFYGVAAAGRPVIFIGSPEGELAEQVADIQCGVTIQPGHAQELVTFLRALRDDPGMRSDMGRRIRAAFDGKYERQHAIRAWRTLLGRLGSAGR